MSAVTFSQVTKRYKDGPKAVDALDLEIADGEFMVLVGPSGCGKSTALRMLAGLEEITEGELSIDDQVVNDLPPGDRDIAMVFQNYALYPHMTVRENIGFALEVAKMDKNEAKRHVEDAAEMLGLTEYLDRLPKALSGGQRQRVAMGRAIVRSPQGVPDGRTAVEPRRQAARPDAFRHHPIAGAARHDDGLRHPRPDRGDDDGPPRRGDAQRHPAAGGAAAAALPRAGEPVRGVVHREPGDEPDHLRGHGRARGGVRVVRRTPSPARARRRRAVSGAAGASRLGR